jgi:hypothetical protein
VLSSFAEVKEVVEAQGREEEGRVVPNARAELIETLKWELVVEFSSLGGERFESRGQGQGGSESLS